MHRTLYTGIVALVAPPHIGRLLIRRGGRNQFGEPKYRLVRAEGRKRLSAGMWFDWQPGTKTKHKNAGANRALRSSFGIKPVPMYPGEHGWVLERYTGAEAYGSRVQWYSPQSMGGTKRWMGPEIGYVLSAGEYPCRGDYEGTGYVFPTSPLDGDEEATTTLSEAVLANAIGRIERMNDMLPSNPYRRAQLEVQAEIMEERRKEIEFDRFAADELQASLDELQVHTPEARAEVGRSIERMGIREHAWD
jgi:hypothetical protein